MGDWSDGEINYVKVRWIQQDNGVHNWLGWLALSDTDPMAPRFIGDPSSPPAGVQPVRWVLDRRGELAEQYLCAIDVPGGGVRYLGSYRASAEFPAWLPTADEAFPIKVARVGDTDELVLVRLSDQAGLYTTDTPGLLQWGWPGSGSPVTLELVPQHDHAGGNENWMREQNAVIGDRKLSQIMLPGAHDAGCSNMWEPSPGTDCSSKTQTLGIGALLRAGVRYLDLRVWKADDGDWWLYHGCDWTNLRFSDVLSEMVVFFQNHPDETVLASLLVEGVQGVNAFDGSCREAWDQAYVALEQYVVNSAGMDFETLTPNRVRDLGASVLLFNWGEVTSWKFDAPDGHQIFAAPWAAHSDGAAGPVDQMDLAGVYVDDSMATARDIYDAYVAHARPGGAWVLHTNTPWGGAGHLSDCLYDKHARNTPELMTWIDQGWIGRAKANIVNIDYVDDVVLADGILYDLTNSVIRANLL